MDIFVYALEWWQIGLIWFTGFMLGLVIITALGGADTEDGVPMFLGSMFWPFCLPIAAVIFLFIGLYMLSIAVGRFLRDNW